MWICNSWLLHVLKDVDVCDMSHVRVESSPGKLCAQTVSPFCAPKLCADSGPASIWVRSPSSSATRPCASPTKNEDTREGVMAAPVLLFLDTSRSSLREVCQKTAIATGIAPRLHTQLTVRVRYICQGTVKTIKGKTRQKVLKVRMEPFGDNLLWQHECIG